jgi:transposase
MGVDELYRGKKDKFVTVVCNLETAEPLWFGKERKKETLDEYFRTELTSRQRKGIKAVCVDMWEPFRLSLEQWVPGGKIIYDKFHVLGHANDAVDEVRKAEFFPARTREARIDQRQEVAAIKPLEEPEWRAPRGLERTVPDEPASVQGLPAQGESRKAVGLPISRGHAELSRPMDGPTEMAAVGAV